MDPPEGEVPPLWLAAVPVEVAPLEVAPLEMAPLEIPEADADEPVVEVPVVAEAVDVGLALADVVACGFLGVLDGVAVAVAVAVVLLPQGLTAALAVTFLPVALRFAKAVAGGDVVAVLVAVLVGLAVAVLVAVAVPVGFAPLAGLVVPPPAGLVTEALAAGVALGLAGLVALPAGDGEELGEQVAAVALVPLLGMLAEVAPPTEVPIGFGLPNPFVPWTPLLLLLLWGEVIPTTVPSWTKAWRSGGNASVTPMANTTQAAAKADRSSPSCQFRGLGRA